MEKDNTRNKVLWPKTEKDDREISKHLESKCHPSNNPTDQRGNLRRNFETTWAKLKWKHNIPKIYGTQQ